MAYTPSVVDVRDLSAILTADIDDTVLTRIVDAATKYFSSQVQTEVFSEILDPLGDNSSNTIFFTKQHPLGDKNFDLTVTLTDVVVWDENIDEDRTELVVSEIDASIGKITLETGRTDTTYIDYVFVPYLLSSQYIEYPAKVVASRWAWDYKLKGLRKFKAGTISKTKDNPFTERENQEMNKLNTILVKVIPWKNRLFLPANTVPWWLR